MRLTLSFRLLDDGPVTQQPGGRASAVWPLDAGLGEPQAHQRSGTGNRPAASSMAWPARNSVASSNGLPISCKPNGVPSEERPAGTEMPGTPAMLAVTVKMSLRYIWIGSPLTSPMPKAGPGVVGVRTTSTF